jgi:phosphoserine aminotransferase
MSEVYNFSAGPACLPKEVLNRAAGEMLDCGGSGQSVMEMSHRSKEFEDIIDECETLLRKLLEIPANYKVLFIQGGANLQFGMIPLNLMKNGEADFVVTGQWAGRAYSEAKRFGKANLVASSKDKTFSYIPDLDPSTFSPTADFFHICYNNTIYGTRFNAPPDTGKVPLAADMSSFLLSEPTDVSKFGLIYACAQKNIGPAGVTFVIIRDDLIRDFPEPSDVPVMLRYKTYADEKSLYNTPPTYAIYICKLVLEWVADRGGLSAMKAYNEKKAAVLYDYLDGSALFKSTVEKRDRSVMNVPFVTGDEALDAKFIKQAAAEGFINLKGHRSVGGMRASIYNAMPIEGVEKFVDFMKAFEGEHV